MSSRYLPSACRVLFGTVLLVILFSSNNAWGQGGFGQRQSVGGVAIDSAGVIRNQEVDNLKELASLRSKLLKEQPGDLKQPTELRKVSLRKLEEAITVRVAELTEGRQNAAMTKYGAIPRFFLAGMRR